jgi:hypothetical protein
MICKCLYWKATGNESGYRLFKSELHIYMEWQFESRKSECEAEWSYTIPNIAFRSGAKKHLSDTECTTFRSCAKQHLSVAIIPLKIAFLKGTDRCFSRHYGKLTGSAGPPREFARPGANRLWGPHDIIIFKLDPSQSPNQISARLHVELL